MKPEDVKMVGVIGCGLMGSGIVEVCARAEIEVTYVEATNDLVTGGRERIETVVGNLEAKLEVFRTLDRVTRDDVMLASNTSSIPIVKLGAATGRPDRVIGMHFFNPPPVMK